MPDLTTYLPFSALQPFFDNARADGDVTHAWRETYLADLARIVHPALSSFFRELKSEGRMVRIPNSDGYSCRHWNNWNDVADLVLTAAPDANAARKLEALAGMFAHNLVFPIVYPYERALKEHGAAAGATFDKTGPYEAAMAKFSLGSFPSHELGHQNCDRTDLPLLLGFDCWVPVSKCVLGHRVVDVPVPEPEQVQETVLEFKTGNLLVADWFRIDEFTQVVTGLKDFSLHSRKGRDEKTRFLAEEFGVSSVFVLGSPSVFQSGNRILVGSCDDEKQDAPAGYSHVGNVCTDLWATTIVEYETLIALVARNNPESAKALVDEYIDAHKGGLYGLHQVTVEPGTYYLYHFGENEEFAERARQAGMELQAGDVEPFFVISRTRMLPTHPA